jgi:drug/metabolite transporter (DMT)-like permease
VVGVFKNGIPHLGAALQALFVTFLWSTLWVLIKIGLEDIPASTFAGLRYALAIVWLLPFGLSSMRRAPRRGLRRRKWAELIVLGLLFYAAMQGAMFLRLAYLQTMIVSLLRSLATVVVALLGIFLLRERPTALRWAGASPNLGGILICFYPALVPLAQAIGFLAVAIGALANAGSSILG